MDVNQGRILLTRVIILHSFKTWSHTLSFYPSLKIFTGAFSVDHVTKLPPLIQNQKCGITEFHNLKAMKFQNYYRIS